MAVKLRPWLLVFFISAIPFSSCQDYPQNIETFYPYAIPSPTPPRNTPGNPPLPPSVSPQPSLPPTEKKTSSTGTVATAVVATAAGTFVVAGFLFFLIQRYVVARRRRVNNAGSNGRPAAAAVHDEFGRIDGNLKGFIVDENGLDVLYWRKLQNGNKNNSFRKEVLQRQDQEQGRIHPENRSRKTEPIQEIPLLRGESSPSYSKFVPELNDPYGIVVPIPPPSTPVRAPSAADMVALKAVEKSKPSSQQPSSSAPPPPPLPPSGAIIPTTQRPAPPPPPPPPIPARKNPAPTPPPPKAGGLATSLKPPSGMPREGKPGESLPGEGTEAASGQVKLKPLHWDKVNTDADHSMVWHKLDEGSFRFDGDLMEALFGCVAANRRPPTRSNDSRNQSNTDNSSSSLIIILEARKSQNISIVLRSLAISRKELIDALLEGRALNADTLEKLTRIAPTNEEQTQILEFDGDPTRLADAESFLYHLLKAVPLAFTRLNAMLFRSNYDSEILHFKESLQTLETGCTELRTRGLFMKLLEAILKAGNRMNAGTTRGNAQAFNLNALRKLSDVKSTDGKTTLLHFVVQEVVRFEGKRCVINRNRSSLSRNSSGSSNSSITSENSASKEEREREYIMLGLPVVGGLSAEFSNVKKAAMIDYGTFAGTCPALTARLAEVRQFVPQCDSNGGGFVREMTRFLEAAEEELEVVREEQMRVMEFVKKTTQYYQAKASKDQGANPLQLFIIIKDFLGMVDQVCVEITRNMQRRRTSMGNLGSSSPKSPTLRMPVRFPNLPEHFMRSTSSSSDSETDF